MPDTPSETLRAHERYEKEITSLWANINSMTKTASENLTKILIGQTSSDRWQESHERLDEERWDNLHSRLGEIQGLIESIPMKVAEDVGKINARLAEHDKVLNMLKGGYFVLAAVGAVVEFFLHLKGV